MKDGADGLVELGLLECPGWNADHSASSQHLL